jgi:hypothetical protein
MLHKYHIICSVQYYPRFYVTTVGLETYYPWIQGHSCNMFKNKMGMMKNVAQTYHSGNLWARTLVLDGINGSYQLIWISH